MAADPSSDLTLHQAMVLALLKPLNEEDDGFASRRSSGIADFDFGTKVLEQLRRRGLVERRQLGLRETGWRLTETGAGMVPHAHALLAEDRARRKREWENENVVYGVWKDATAPMTFRQQRAWVRGYMLEQMKALGIPDDAPRDVLENAGELMGWMEQRLAPHNPFENDPPRQAGPRA